MEEWELRAYAMQYAALWDRYCSDQILPTREELKLREQMLDIRESLPVGYTVEFFDTVTEILLPLSTVTE